MGVTITEKAGTVAKATPTPGEVKKGTELQ
jgi:hypothetical protein